MAHEAVVRAVEESKGKGGGEGSEGMGMGGRGEGKGRKRRMLRGSWGWRLMRRGRWSISGNC